MPLAEARSVRVPVGLPLGGGEPERLVVPEAESDSDVVAVALAALDDVTDGDVPSVSEDVGVIVGTALAEGSASTLKGCPMGGLGSPQKLLPSPTQRGMPSTMPIKQQKSIPQVTLLKGPPETGDPLNCAVPLNVTVAICLLSELDQAMPTDNSPVVGMPSREGDQPPQQARSPDTLIAQKQASHPHPVVTMEAATKPGSGFGS